MVINEKCIIEYINEGVYKRILGYSNEGMIGKHALEFAIPEQLESSKEALGKVFSSRKNYIHKINS